MVEMTLRRMARRRRHAGGAVHVPGRATSWLPSWLGGAFGRRPFPRGDRDAELAQKLDQRFSLP
jgi:hypothetical protein